MHKSVYIFAEENHATVKAVDWISRKISQKEVCCRPTDYTNPHLELTSDQI